MAQANLNTAVNTAVKMKQYAASGSARNFKTDSPDGQTCARMVMLLAAGSLTSAKDYQDTLFPGTVAGTLGPFAAGAQIPGNISECISADSIMIAFW